MFLEAMNKHFSKLFISLAFVLALVFAVNAQGEASTANGRPAPKEDLPKNIKESLVKQRIEREKKDYREMLERGEEALKLSDELEKSIAQTSKLSSQDQIKLERLEKIVKKIRKELGGDDDDGLKSAFTMDASPLETEKDEMPLTVASAVKKLQSSAAKLFDELKKTTRFSISAMAIQSSNALLKIVKFVRFYK
jgi:hypothetical protein